MYPMKFMPILKSTIWGGGKIAEYKGVTTDQNCIGESWELSGVKGNESVVVNGEYKGVTITELLSKYGSELLGKDNYLRFGNEFPLLIKFIDAKDDLSIQVHPNDDLAAKRHNSKGKTEMWYVIDADENAKLRSGFAKEVTSNVYVQSVEEDNVLDILKEYNVSRGDLFFLPAGRIHSIGAGCFIAEIQQTSDITYRIYDFNRCDANGNSRELHTEHAKDAIDYTFLDDYRTRYDRESTNCGVSMVDCDYFKTNFYNLTNSITVNLAPIDSFVIFVCVKGSAAIDCDGYCIELKQGETILFPATSKIAKVFTSDECKFLSTYI